ncbi:MAG TPA: prolyl oligopeptidase family serine peptidase [Terracidiphilus sp.]|nr:prolyl oligopeptidase family serine peptidase [Terracidiphilus sp.]
MRLSPRLTATLTLFLAFATGFSQSIRGRSGITLPPPPEVKSTPVTDDYFGTKVVDNYRWLEDEKSDATQAFIDAENNYTDRYFKQDRIYSQIPDQLGSLIDVTETTAPVERNDNYFFMRRLGGEQQYSIYMRHGWTGKDERLLDPAVISRDPNTSISLYDVSRDGSLFIYSIKQGGADEAAIRVFDVKAKKTLLDELPSARYFSTSFAPDGKSFYYARYNKRGTLLYQHVLGERPIHDQLVFGHEFRGEPLAADDLLFGHVTDDGRYLVVQIDRGVPAHRVDIVFRDLTKKDSYFDILVWSLEARFDATYAQGAWYVKTDYQAPMGRILKADPGVMPEAWKTIVPEGKEVIANWSIVGGKIYVTRLKDVQPKTQVYALDGKPAGELAYDSIGSASGVRGRTTDRYGYYSFDSFIVPPTLYRLDTVTGKKEVFFQPKIPFDSSQYELKQVFCKSKDGARVPIFIAGRKGLKMDGSERLLMTGYGGFNVSLLPGWNPQYAWWLEQGGWFAVPNLRGGGEYGEQWHEQGMFEKKQNVFDDWFAAAQYLIDNKYTSPAHFAIMGRSNGGLLMGASITQHPELFGAVECGYPLLDMLRYQKFKVGSFWITEYGSAGNEKQFPYLLKYSPYQNVKESDAYPAVLFFTGDSDTRVDPLHARKMTALLQSESKSGRPVLLHYGRGGGHSAGVSVDQEIDDYSMELAFLWTETGH